MCAIRRCTAMLCTARVGLVGTSFSWVLRSRLSESLLLTIRILGTFGIRGKLGISVLLFIQILDVVLYNSKFSLLFTKLEATTSHLLSCSEFGRINFISISKFDLFLKVEVMRKACSVCMLEAHFLSCPYLKLIPTILSKLRMWLLRW